MKTFVSRGGLKLEAAFEAFPIDAVGKTAADLGCSTGGFTDCLLQQGASHVYAVDTGYGVLDWKLRNDPRVVVMERQNALHVELPELVDIVVIDAGWTMQDKILPKALSLVKVGGSIVTLLKTHYESHPTERLRGIVKEEFQERILERVLAYIATLPVEVIGTIPSPITGGKGKNQEYVTVLRKLS